MAQMLVLATIFLFFLSKSDALPDGLHPTPPMGWTSWNTFFENNTEDKMISQVCRFIIALEGFSNGYSA